MANDLTKNPWIIDTPAATVLSTEKMIRFESFRWEGTSIVVGDQVVVQDQTGREIWRGVSDTNGEGDEFRLGQLFNVNGLIVPTLTHGVLHAYYR